MSCSCSQCKNSGALWIVPALFLQTFFFLGTVKCIGIALPELQRSLGITTRDVGLSLGLFYAFGFGPGPLMVYLYNLRTPRRFVLMTGAVLAPLGLLLTSIISNADHLALCLSMAGLGSNMVSISVVLSLNDQGKEHFALYYGLGKSGYAVGMVVAPLLTDYLMELYGWRSALAILGAFMCNLIPLTMTINVYPKDALLSANTNSAENAQELSYRKTKDPKTNEYNDCMESTPVLTGHAGRVKFKDKIEVKKSSETCGKSSIAQRDANLEEKCGKCRAIRAKIGTILEFLSSMLNHQLVIIIVGTGLFSMGDGGWHSFLVPRALGIGIPTAKVLHLAYSAAAASFLGRCLSGIFLLPHCLTTHDWFLLLTLINCLSILVDILVGRYVVLIATSFVSALSLAERGMLVVILSKQQAAPSAFPFILAVIDIVYGIGALMGTYIAGLVADVFSDFNASFMFCAAIDTVVLVLMLTSRIVEKLRQTSN